MVTVKKMDEGIWVFRELKNGEPKVDAYLIEGKENAILIDSLTDVPELYEKVREITKQPLEVLITHGHPDHAGTALEAFYKAGCNIYMSELDIPLLSPSIDAAWFNPLSYAMGFSVGDRKLEVIPLPGHTPGSVMFFDRANQLLFTGDSIGAGVFWMHLPHSLPLCEFLASFEALWKEFGAYSNLKIHPGHRNQAPAQLTREFMEDVLVMTRNIVSGQWVGEDAKMNWRGNELRYKILSYKLMKTYCYNQFSLK